MDWIELFPFSDKPIAVFEVFDLFPGRYKQPWQLRRLLTTLSNSPHVDVLAVLQKLIEQHPQIIEEDGCGKASSM